MFPTHLSYTLPHWMTLFNPNSSSAANSAPTLTQPWWTGLSNPQDLRGSGKNFWQSSSLICVAMYPTDAVGESGSGANWEWKGKWEGFLNWYFKERLPLPQFLFANPNHQLPKVVRRRKLVTLALNKKMRSRFWNLLTWSLNPLEDSPKHQTTSKWIARPLLASLV